MNASRLWLEADIARSACRRCRRVRTEQVPLARPSAWVGRERSQEAVREFLNALALGT
jgi:hypothetical protein